VAFTFRLTIKRKLFIGFLAVAFLAGIVGFLGFASSRQVVSDLEGGEKFLRSIVSAATEVNSYAQRAGGHLLMFLALGEEDDREKFFIRYAALQEQIAILDENVQASEARLILGRIQSAESDLVKFGEFLIREYNKALENGEPFDFPGHEGLIRKFTETVGKIRESAVDLARFSTDFLNKQETITASTEVSSYAKRLEEHLMLYLMLHNGLEKFKFFRLQGSLQDRIQVLNERIKHPEALLLLEQIRVFEKELYKFGKQLVESHDRDIAQDQGFSLANYRDLLSNFNRSAAGVRRLGVQLAEFEVGLESQLRADTLKNAENLQRNILILMVGVFFVALSLGQLMSRSIASKVNGIKDAAIAFGQGEFDKKIAIKSNDELGTLATSLNKMADDISDTLVSKDYVENIVSSIMDTLLVLTTDFTIQKANRASLETLGFAEQELLGRPITDLLDPGVSLSLFNEVFRKGFIHNAEINYHCRDGQSLPVLFSASLMRDRKGEIQGVVCVARDITERKQSEQERERLQGQLLHAQKMETIGTLAGGVAHDFNNILTPLLGYLELAQDEVDSDSEVRESIGYAIQATHRARDLVQQILTFSRRGDQERRPLQLKFVIKEALKLLRSTLPSTIRIDAYLADACDDVLADPTQMHQVIMNLGANAYHAMAKDGGALTVRLDTVDSSAELQERFPHLPESRYVRLQVSDDGHGMDTQTISRIFEPFFTTKDVGEGTGLGLSVVHGIVTEHAGMIDVQSEIGRGTTFTILLPSAFCEGESDVTVSSTEAIGAERILFVDDEEVIALLGKEMLERLGYQVTSVADSREALSLFQQDQARFDIVITDLTMPHLTGLQLAREMKRQRHELPIILLSGYIGSLSSEEIREAGISATLVKPIVATELGAVVRRLIDSGSGAASEVA